ncbi:MAG: hypothetical protein V7731_01845 [Amphritea sp.]
MKLSELAVNAEANAFAKLLDAGSVEFYTGAPPADTDQAATGTLLAIHQLPTPAFSAAAGGQAAMNQALVHAITAAGQAGWARLKTRFGLTVQDVTVGTSAADLIVNNDSFAVGKNILIYSYTYTRPRG